MIRIQYLTKDFGRFRALDNVSFHVAPGEAVAVLGPNGSGKTTTLKCIAGLIRPTTGAVLADGMDVSRDPRGARRKLAYLPQRVAFPENLTAREILEFYCRLRHIPLERIPAALAEAGLGGCEGKRTGEFSGGMTQRLGIAVTLLAATPIILLDEPTASLDPEGVVAFRRTTLALKEQGRTIVFSCHSLDDVQRLADKAAVLVAGRLAVFETIRDLSPKLRGRSLEDVYLSFTHETDVFGPGRFGDSDECGVSEQAAPARRH